MSEVIKSQYHAVLQSSTGDVYFASNPIRATLRKSIEVDIKEKNAKVLGVFKGKQIPVGTKVVETLSIG